VIKARPVARWLCLQVVLALEAASRVVGARTISPVSAIGTSLLARSENRRFTAPLVPLVLMSGVAVVHAGSRGLMTRAR
jgi:hypothetical protein